MAEREIKRRDFLRSFTVGAAGLLVPAGIVGVKRSYFFAPSGGWQGFDPGDPDGDWKILMAGIRWVLVCSTNQERDLNEIMFGATL